MKIRTGFVSNSSASSFVLVVPNDLFEAYQKLFPFEGKVMDDALEEKTIAGVQFRIFSDANDHDGNGPWDYWDGVELTDEEQAVFEKEYYESWHEIFYHFKNYFGEEKLEKQCISIEQDW